jgi:hypothetical protein
VIRVATERFYRMTHSSFRRLVGPALIVGLSLLWICYASASNDIPADKQGILFKKILNYDRVLQGQKLKLYVVHGPKTASDSDTFKKAFEDSGLSPEVIPLTMLDKTAKSGEVAYLMPEVVTSDTRDICKRLALLCLAGSDSAADDGLVAIAVGLRSDGRPLIVVNQSLVHNAGHELSADLLKLARVVQ